MKKFLTKVLGIALSAITVLGVAACDENVDSTGGKESGEKNPPIELLVWGAQDDQYMLGEMAAAYEAANPDKTYNFKFGVVGEPDVISKLSTDIATSADVFSFPSDQLRDMVNQGMLYEVPSNLAGTLAQANTPASMTAVSLNDKVYGFPSTADNTYF